MSVSKYPFSHDPNSYVGNIKHIGAEYDFDSDLEKLFITPLISGSAYHVNIRAFQPLSNSALLDRFHDSGLSQNIQHGYKNEYNIIFKPYAVEFEFRYADAFVKNLKEMFYKVSSSHVSSKIDINDLRRFDMPCVVFGDFDLEYIEREGWYGIKHFYFDEILNIRLEAAKLLAKRLYRMQSNLFFSFLDSKHDHVVGVYSDFHDYVLTIHNTKIARKIGRIMVNTNRGTFSTYQVEPLSPMAMSYKLRTFFLTRENQNENLYSFIIFLNEEEIDRIRSVKAWANAEWQ